VNKNICIDSKLLESVYFTMMDLNHYIACLPKKEPLMWFADSRTPVVDLDGFKRSSELIDKMKVILESTRNLECQNSVQSAICLCIVSPKVPVVRKGGSCPPIQPLGGDESQAQ